MHDPARLWKAWFAPGSFIEYYPVEETVQWMQWKLWGTDTFGYHLTNVILHISSALLVWRLFSKFKLRLAWLGALIFAIHPAHVESVAWISELKNTLSLPAFLLAMCAYIDYDENRRSRDYWQAIGWFLAAMLCKISMAAFPIIILLYAWWKRDRIGRSDLKASAPFFVISLTLGITSVLAGSHFFQSHMVSEEVFPIGGFFSRLALAGLSFSFYFSKCLLPTGLMPVYPKWTVNPPSLLQFLPWFVLGGGFYWLWRNRRNWSRHVLLGLGFFLLNLLPFLGFKAVSYMCFTWIMDHFLYIPSIAIIGLVTAGLEQIYSRLSPRIRPYGIGVQAAVVMLLALESHAYAGIFASEETIWNYALQRTPESWPAHFNLGCKLAQEGRLHDATEHLRQAVRINPNYAHSHKELGDVLFKTGDVASAMVQYREAVRIKPDYTIAYKNLGDALVKMNQDSKAMELYKMALNTNPNYADAHFALGNALLRTGQTTEAIEQFEQAILIDPNHAEAHNTLGALLFKEGRFDEAIDHFTASLKINPDNAVLHNNLGILLAKEGRIPEAIEQFKFALKLKPDYANAQNNLVQMQEILVQRNR